MHKFQLKWHYKFIPKRLINTTWALVQIIIWTNDGLFSDAYMRHWAWKS